MNNSQELSQMFYKNIQGYRGIIMYYVKENLKEVCRKENKHISSKKEMNNAIDKLLKNATLNNEADSPSLLQDCLGANTKNIENTECNSSDDNFDFDGNKNSVDEFDRRSISQKKFHKAIKTFMPKINAWVKKQVFKESRKKNIIISSNQEMVKAYERNV